MPQPGRRAEIDYTLDIRKNYGPGGENEGNTQTKEVGPPAAGAFLEFLSPKGGGGRRRCWKRRNTDGRAGLGGPESGGAPFAPGLAYGSWKFEAPNHGQRSPRGDKDGPCRPGRAYAGRPGVRGQHKAQAAGEGLFSRSNSRKRDWDGPGRSGFWLSYPKKFLSTCASPDRGRRRCFMCLPERQPCFPHGAEGSERGTDQVGTIRCGQALYGLTGTVQGSGTLSTGGGGGALALQTPRHGLLGRTVSAPRAACCRWIGEEGGSSDVKVGSKKRNGWKRE